MQLLPLPSVRAESESYAQAGADRSRPTEKQASFQSMLDRIGKDGVSSTDGGRARSRVNSGDQSERRSENKPDDRESVRGDELGVGLAGEETVAVTAVVVAEPVQDGSINGDERANGIGDSLQPTAAGLVGRSATEATAIDPASSETTTAGEVPLDLDPVVPSVLESSVTRGARGAQVAAPAAAWQPSHLEGRAADTTVASTTGSTTASTTELLPPWADDGAGVVPTATEAGPGPSSVADAAGGLFAEGRTAASSQRGVDATDVGDTARAHAESAQAAASAAGSAEDEGAASARPSGQGALFVGETDSESTTANPSSDADGGGQSVTSATAGRHAGDTGTGHSDARRNDDGQPSPTVANSSDGASFAAASTTAGSDVSGAPDLVALQSSGPVDTAMDATPGAGAERSSVVSQLAEPLQELIESMIRGRGPDRTEQVSIRLKPEFLGEVLLRVSVDAAGTVNARFVVDNPVVRAMIEQDIGQLQATLDEHGLVLGEASVDAGFSSWADGDAGELSEGMPTYTRLPAGQAAASTDDGGADAGAQGVVTSDDGTMTIDIRV